MRTTVRSLALLVLLATPASAATARLPAQDPAARFAGDVGARAQLGWRLADLAVDEHLRGDASTLTLLLTLAAPDDTKAERHTLVFDGKGETILGGGRAADRAPSDARIYPGWDELRRALAAGPITGLYEECGAYFLQVAGRDVVLDPLDYYAVVGRRQDAEAGIFLAEALSAGLDRGMKLRWLEAADDGRSVDFVLAGTSSQLVAHAELDAAGRVHAVELRDSPRPLHLDSYRGGARLARALRQGGQVVGVAFAMGESAPRATLSLPGGRRFVIDLSDADRDERWECGC